MATSLSAARLRRLLDYDPKTGRFTWRKDMRGPARAGMRAGTIDKRSGQRQIKIDQVSYRAGRLAVFWTTGRWPKQLINHANGHADDDRWSNLREATHMQASATKRLQKTKRAPLLKGVYWNKQKSRYQAQIKAGRHKFLGRFDDPREAHAAYAAAARKYFGEFARTS